MFFANHSLGPFTKTGGAHKYPQAHLHWLSFVEFSILIFFQELVICKLDTGGHLQRLGVFKYNEGIHRD